MELEVATKRIEELEDELMRLKQEGLDPEDRSYVERLKADMRKAAQVREESEAKAADMEKRLGREILRHRLVEAALGAGCVDATTFAAAMEAKGLPDAGMDDEGFSRWFEDAKSRHPYFFTAVKSGDPEGRSANRGPAPYVATGKKRKAADILSKAAAAYRT